MKFIYLFLVGSILTFYHLHSERIESIYYNINNDIVSKSDFEHSYQLFLNDPISKKYNIESGKTFVISNVIFDKLIEQKLFEEGIEVSTLDVSNQINQTMHAMGIRSLSDFKLAIQSQIKISFEDYYEIVNRKLRYSALISKLIFIKSPSPREIEEYYLLNKDRKFKINNPIFNLSLIHLKVPSQASFSVKKNIEKKLINLVKRINQKEISFEEAAKRNSEDPSSKKIGGNIGWVDPDRQEMNNKEKLELNKLIIGEISPLIVFNQGVGVYRLNDKKSSGYYPYSLAKNISKNFITKTLREIAIIELINNMYESAYIKINTTDLTYMPKRFLNKPQPVTKNKNKKF